MGQQRRTYTDDFKAAAVDRLYEPDATQGSVAKELGITGTQLKPLGPQRPSGVRKPIRRSLSGCAKKTSAWRRKWKSYTRHRLFSRCGR
jgi:hypothetical protein